MGRSICIYQNIRELKILTFWEILRTDNHSLLDKDYDGSYKHTKKELEKLEEAWLDISDEYFLVKNDDRAKIYIKKRKDEVLLLKKIGMYAENLQILDQLLQRLGEIDRLQLARMVNECYQMAKKIEPRTKIKTNSTLEYNLKTMDSMLAGLINKHKFKYGQRRKAQKKELSNTYDMVAAVEGHLERSLPNIETMVVAQWIAYEKSAKRKLEASRIRNKKGLKNGR